MDLTLISRGLTGATAVPYTLSQLSWAFLGFSWGASDQATSTNASSSVTEFIRQAFESPSAISWSPAVSQV